MVGMFKVIAPVLPPEPIEPYITPTSGIPGSTFTIYDPAGSMRPGDVAMFYLEGTDPVLGQNPTNLDVSPDGKTMTGNVPITLTQGAQHYVAVRPTSTDPSRFGDLAFFVTPG